MRHNNSLKSRESTVKPVYIAHSTCRAKVCIAWSGVLCIKYILQGYKV